MMDGAAAPSPSSRLRLDTNGAALAATGAALPVASAPGFTGAGSIPDAGAKNGGANYEFGIELQPLTRSKAAQRLQSDVGAARRQATRRSHSRPRRDPSGNRTTDRGAPDESRSEHRRLDRGRHRTRTRFRSLEVSCTGSGQQPQ